jgi:hypothetical protein
MRDSLVVMIVQFRVAKVRLQGMQPLTSNSRRSAVQEPNGVTVPVDHQDLHRQVEVVRLP